MRHFALGLVLTVFPLTSAAESASSGNEGWSVGAGL